MLGRIVGQPKIVLDEFMIIQIYLWIFDVQEPEDLGQPKGTNFWRRSDSRDQRNSGGWG